MIARGVRRGLVALLLGATAAATGCTSTTCGDGTIDDNGTCTPADETVTNDGCGSGTVLEGDQCVATNPPTQCDPATTIPMTDPVTGVVTCVGNGVGGCSATFACPSPDSGKQTVCGQLYDFEDNSKLQTSAPSGSQCSGSDTAGPCGLMILPFDAVAFATAVSMGSNPAPLASDPPYIDDCGRYRVTNIQPNGALYIALGIDDAGQPFGPTGETVTTGVAIPTAASTATANFEAFTVDETTAGGWDVSWMQSGGSAGAGPNLANGLYAAVFRSHACAQNDAMCGSDGSADPFATASGVAFTANSARVSGSNAFYFADGANHDAIDAAGSATTSNGSVIATNLTLGTPIYSGTGGLTDTTNCAWQHAAGATLPGIVLFQIYRPASAGLGKTCTE